METTHNNLGDQELGVLSFVTENAPITVRSVAEQWGYPRGLARTTILTMMERLRLKGHLVRERTADEAAWVYTPAVPKQALMHNVVQNFVDKSLGGTVAPFVAYLSEGHALSQEEKDELRRLVAQMDE
jgi:predicted transcriptional regulator